MRIAQITDFHLREVLPGTSAVDSRLSRELSRLLPEALRLLKTQAVDFLAVTGDLVDAPDASLSPDAEQQPDYAEWLEQAESDYRLIRSLLDDTGIPYMVLPGNHDLEPAFWRVFDEASNEVLVGSHRMIRFCDREGDGHVPQRVGTERARWADVLRDGDVEQIHLQHYVVTPDLNEGYPHSYADGDAIRKATVESGRVRLSLSGHYHRGTDLIEEGICAFVAGPCFCDAPHRYRIYELTGSGIRLSNHALK